MRRTKCPTCGSDRCFEFYSVSGVPTNSCLLISDQEQALKFPTGDIELSSCRECGFIFNSVWEPQRTIYSERYEETQGFSSTFNAFSRQLAEELVERHDLRGKDVLDTSTALGKSTEYAEQLSRCDARFEIGCEDPDKMLPKSKTLNEIQWALQELTRGQLYNTWDKKLSGAR